MFIIKKRCSEQSTLTINDINDFFDELCFAADSEEKSKVLTKFIRKASIIEQKWAVHIILKDLKIGIGHETLFKQFDPRALDVYNSTSSLKEVCKFIADPKNSKYANTLFQIFCPIKPMLAGRMTLNNIINNFNGININIETKYDGERIQCHINGNEVKFFTRNGIDYSYLYGPKLGNIILNSVNANSAILDGEIVVWDKKNMRCAPFGENKTIAKEEDSEKDLFCILID